jgi:hypothetical protein
MVHPLHKCRECGKASLCKNHYVPNETKWMLDMSTGVVRCGECHRKFDKARYEKHIYYLP